MSVRPTPAKLTLVLLILRGDLLVCLAVVTTYDQKLVSGFESTN